MVKLNCRQCGREFKVHLYRINTAKFCSRKCQNSFRLGKKLSSEHRKKIIQGLLGHKAWNKDKTMNEFLKDKTLICCDCGQTVKHTGTAQVRCVTCIPNRKKQYLENYRKNNPKKPPEILRICQQCSKEFKVYAYQVEKGEAKFCSRACSGKNKIGIELSKEHRFNVSRALKGKMPKNINLLKEKAKIANIELWKNKERREKQLEIMLRGLIKRPTSLEEDMIKLIKKYNLPYKYTGNGDVWIGGKNPDFININGEKKLIEVGNIYHHQGNYIQERRKHFAKYGWKSYIFISDRLNETEILKRMGVS